MAPENRSIMAEGLWPQVADMAAGTAESSHLKPQREIRENTFKMAVPRDTLPPARPDP